MSEDKEKKEKMSEFDYLFVKTMGNVKELAEKKFPLSFREVLYSLLLFLNMSKDELDKLGVLPEILMNNVYQLRRLAGVLTRDEKRIDEEWTKLLAEINKIVEKSDQDK